MHFDIRYQYASSSSNKGARCLAVLGLDNWDDFTFKTMFTLSVYDEKGNFVECGAVKIGFKGQDTGRTSQTLNLPLGQLPEGYFSLGQDVEYYRTIRDKLSEEFAESLLKGLRDVVFDPSLLQEVEKEPSFQTSLTRSVSMSVVHGQFNRILAGGVPLTEFKFDYCDPGSDKTSKIELSFHVVPNSKPPTNIHVLIGRNGVGKTTLLNNMIHAIVRKHVDERGVFTQSSMFGKEPLSDDFFSAVVSVSFSAFDPFRPLRDRPTRNEEGVAYFYVGMKKVPDSPTHRIELKTHDELCADFITSLSYCFSADSKKKRWIEAIRRLESDDNFAEMRLTSLAELDEASAVAKKATNLFERMSSGHAIVLLTMTRLVDTVDEKTLVLMDEPESHLHPPLLSAFTRALSELLSNRNGVAIIATHSPVVVQEVPQSCVWTMERSRLEGRTDRPPLETFGENVGVLTREIFGLEVTRSGFHDVLRRAVEEGKSYSEIMDEYGGHLGFEAQALLRAMVVSHASANDEEDEF